MFAWNYIVWNGKKSRVVVYRGIYWMFWKPNLAERCGMSYSYFAKLFRRNYHQSCKEYIEFVRINRVTDLLLFTKLDLTYISQETGFSDCSHLIRTFRKWKGCTPRQWMREYSSELNSGI